MTLQPLDLTGGKSVYCFNQQQLNGAFDLFQSDTPSGRKIRELVNELEATCTRNEQAALAFVLIDHLNKTSEY